MLMKDLLDRYDNTIRPVSNLSQPTKVWFSISLLQIIDVTWHDEFLIWNVTEYGNIDYTYIPISELWIPDITLYNNIRDYHNDDVYAHVSFNGTVTYRVNDVTRTSCKLELLYFPIDRQQCSLKFGSWSYSSKYITTIPGFNANDTSSYVSNGEWTLLGLGVEHGIEFNARFEEPFSYIEFTIAIQRLPLFYVFNLMIPSALLSTMMLLAFCLPPESGEKMALSISNLLGMLIFQQLVMQALPPSYDNFPYLVYHFGLMIALTSSTCVMTVWVLSLFHRETHPKEVPDWARRLVFGFMQPCLGMGKGSYYRSCLEKNGENPFDFVPKCQEISENENESHPNSSNVCFKVDKPMKGQKLYRDTNISIFTAKNIESLLGHAKDLSTRAWENEYRKAVLGEWKELARVIDRLLLVVFGTLLASAFVVCAVLIFG
ncbi:neuronal acetylcholine receptor subunit alpha-7-like [Glandiceps talaboti]